MIGNPFARRKTARKAPPSAERRNAAWLANSRARAERYGVPHEDVDRLDIWRASSGRCHLCGRSHPYDSDWQGDHKAPISQGNAHILANLRVACKACNKRKAAAVRPPPAYVQAAARSIAWHASERLTKPGARILPLCRVAEITKAPQCYTVRLAVAPRHVPKLLEPMTADILTSALGLQAPVAIVRDGACVAVQVPMPRPALVRLATMRAEGGRVGLGIDTAGRILAVDLANANTAHAFIAGTTGSGKTSLARAWIALLAQANTPDALRIVGIDVKQELFSGPLATLPHLLYRIATTPDDGRALVAWVRGEVDRRMAAQVKRPRILVVLDEAWSLGAGEVEHIARLGRSLGIHLLAMSQRGVSSDMEKAALTQFGVRICGLLGPDDMWTAKNLGALDLYPALLNSGDFSALIAGDPARQARRFQAAYAPDADPYWHPSNWPDPVEPPAIPGGKRQPSPAPRPAAPAVTLEAIAARVKAEHRGPLTANAIRLWTVANAILGHDHEGNGIGIGYERAKAIANQLTNPHSLTNSPSNG